VGAVPQSVEGAKHVYASVRVEYSSRPASNATSAIKRSDYNTVSVSYPHWTSATIPTRSSIAAFFGHPESLVNLRRLGRVRRAIKLAGALGCSSPVCPDGSRSGPS